MLTQIVLFAIIISGSILGAGVLKKSFEEIVPITSAGIIFILFLSGICGILRQGVFFVLILGAGLWSCTLCFLIKKKNWREFCDNLVTPAFLLFVFAFIILTYTNYGMLAASWDEFSHWADSVKAMVFIDDFGTNPTAHTIFPSYPPGMSLYQYFFEKVFMLLNPGELFSEWRLYFSYQILFISFLMPFLKKLSLKNMSYQRLVTMFTVAVLCCLGPMIVFNDIYIVLLIDAFLGLLAGTGMAAIFAWEDKDWSYDAYVLSNIALLILVKDAGMLFAAFIFATYCFDNLFIRSEIKGRKIVCSILGVVVLLLPKILWVYNIKMNDAYVAFSNKVDFSDLFAIIFGIDKTSYRVDVIQTFFHALFNRYFEITVLGIRVPYVLAFTISLILCYGVYKAYKKNNKGSIRSKKLVLILVITEVIVYIFGLCVTYMFKFSEYEAVGLASFERYMNIMLQGMTLFIILTVVHFITVNEKKQLSTIFVLGIVLLLLPWGMIKDIAMRTTVDNTVNTRIRYMPLIEKIESAAEDRGQVLKINIIAQESAGYDGLILRYSLRPHQIIGAESIGKPFYDGDIWTKEKNAEQWKNELKKEVDFVALYHLNDYFMEEFSEVFENAQAIGENELYYVNKETGMLSVY